MSEVIAGKVWKFGDNINTDLMLPNVVNQGASTLDEQARMVFSANRPGWVDEMRPGDFIIGGRAYGIGSNRPAARSLRHLGISCLIAESINGLFFRNCVNFGLLALECPGLSAAFEEGHIAEVSLADFTVHNRNTGAAFRAKPVPHNLLLLMRNGGVFPLLEMQGLIAAERRSSKKEG
jgi:3-isopropylmalate/(R)-2-methylmalate dehydratase small subunit